MPTLFSNASDARTSLLASTAQNASTLRPASPRPMSQRVQRDGRLESCEAKGELGRLSRNRAAVQWTCATRTERQDWPQGVRGTAVLRGQSSSLPCRSGTSGQSNARHKEPFRQTSKRAAEKRRMPPRRTATKMNGRAISHKIRSETLQSIPCPLHAVRTPCLRAVFLERNSEAGTRNRNAPSPRFQPITSHRHKPTQHPPSHPYPFSKGLIHPLHNQTQVIPVEHPPTSAVTAIYSR
jgi:hypothetical protein